MYTDTQVEFICLPKRCAPVNKPSQGLVFDVKRKIVGCSRLFPMTSLGPCWYQTNPGSGNGPFTQTFCFLARWMPFVCHTRMQYHFICNLTTQIQCVFKKYNVPTYKKSECFLFFPLTQLHDVWLHADWQKGGWVGGKAVASKKKKTGSHDRMRYLKSQPPVKCVRISFLAKLSRQEKHFLLLLRKTQGNWSWVWNQVISEFQ